MVAGVANAAAADDGKKVNLNSYMAMTCILGGIGGLIFGYDIGISGGVTAMAPFLERFFPAVYRRQIRASSDSQYCKFNDFNLTAFTSSLYVAAFFASLVASFVTKGLGRKISMLLGGIVFFVGALLNMLAQHLWMLIVGRILLGIGVGFSVQSVPVYVSEMAPPQWRGSFNIVFQLSITVGIFAANLINYFTSKNIHYGWRVSLGGACVPAAIIIISSFFLPNTPNSLLEQGKPDEARAVLKRIRGASDVDSEFREIEAASVAAKSVPNPWKNIVKRKNRPYLVMSLLIPSLQQLTGINVVMFYAPVLFQSIGIGSHASLLSAVVTGTVNVAATFVSIYGVDRYGGAQMLIFQILVAIFIGWKFGVSGVVTQLPTWYALVVVFFICLYVAAYAWSWGPLGFVVPSEIFPLEIRSAGQSINVSMNMLFTFLIAQLFLTMLCHMKFGLFLFFAFFLVVMTLFVYFFLPETKGIPIEAVHGKFREHWYWRRFVDDDGSESGRVKSSKRVEDFI
ncbi:Sugar transport protein 1 [Linum perenne]